MEAILLLNSNWKQYESAELLSPDLMIGFWPDKSDWLITLDAASAHMTHAPFLINTMSKPLVWLADQVYVRCTMSRLKTATAGDQASLQALRHKPKAPVRTEQPTTEVFQYDGPPKDMLRGPSGPAPINMPPRTRRNAVSATHAGPNDLELWMRDQAMSAGNSSSHFELFEAQKTKGWSPHFASFRRNALGNLSVRALKGMCYAWKRWREHTMEFCIYGKISTEAGAQEAIYTACAPQLAHYFGHRSLKGKTAAAGAHTALSMCVKALGLNFPLDDKSVSRWYKELKTHVPIQQTPMEWQS